MKEKEDFKENRKREVDKDLKAKHTGKDSHRKRRKHNDGRPEFNKLAALRLVFRFMLACYCFGVYLGEKTLLDLTFLPKWKGMYVMCGILLFSLVIRFFPLKIFPIGMRKHLKSTFEPTRDYAENPHLTKEDHRELERQKSQFIRGLLLYCVVTAVWFVLYFMKIFTTSEMFLVVMAYFVGDMICVNIFCPYKFVMKNRCCSVCRIYNWDAIFLVFPLVVVPGILPWVLVAVAIAYTVIWEVNYHLHPERFLERTNAALRCANCPKDLCPRKRKEFIKTVFSKE